MSSDTKKRYYVYAIIFIVIVGIVLFFALKNKNSQNKNNQDNSVNNVARLATESNILGNTEELNSVNNRVENILSQQTTQKEEEIASYSTKLSGSTENRLTNIRISCKKLNGTTVNNGETFSFCDKTRSFYC